MPEASLCEKCGVREAFYIKRDSGEKLCKKCLYRSIERNIIRSLSRYSGLRREEKILYVDTFIPNIWDVSLLKIITKISSNYKNQIYLLTFPWKQHFYKDLMDSIFQIIIDPVNYIMLCSEGFNDYISFITCFTKIRYLIGVEKALDMNIKKILIPCTRNDIFLKNIFSFIYSVKEMISETYPQRAFDEIIISNPIYNLITEDLIALSLTDVKDDLVLEKSLQQFFSSIDHRIKEFLSKFLNDEIIRELYTLGLSSREFMFSHPNLMSKYYSRYKRCRICSAPIDNEKHLCRYCLTLHSSFEKISKIFR